MTIVLVPPSLFVPFSCCLFLEFLENCGFQEQQNRHFTTTLRGMQGGPVRHTTCDHYDQYGRSLYGPEYGPPPHQYCCAEEWSNQHPEHQHSYENGLHDYSSVNPSSVHSYTMHSAPSMCAMPYLPPNDYPVSSHYVSSPSSRKHPRSTNESDSEETSEENYGYENGSDARHENNASDEENESRSSSSSSSYYPVKGESSSMLDLIAVAAGVSSDQPRARKRIIMNTIPHHHKRI